MPQAETKCLQLGWILKGPGARTDNQLIVGPSPGNPQAPVSDSHMLLGLEQTTGSPSPRTSGLDCQPGAAPAGVQPPGHSRTGSRPPYSPRAGTANCRFKPWNLHENSSRLWCGPGAEIIRWLLIPGPAPYWNLEPVLVTLSQLQFKASWTLAIKNVTYLLWNISVDCFPFCHAANSLNVW